VVEFESLCVHSSLSNRQRLGHDPPGVTSHPRPRVEGWPTALWDDAFMAVDTPLRPSGSVTFLFTDVEGSTRLWEEHPTEMQVALERHDAILRTAIEAHGGYVFSTAGDAFAAAFARAGDAIEAAIDAQRGLSSERWPAAVIVAARMGLHTGQAQERGGDYFGPVLNRAARIMSAGHGGQILVAGSTNVLIDGLELVDLGRHRLKDLSDPEHLFQVAVEGIELDFPPLRTVDSAPGNLPVQATSFIGRDADVQELIDLVRAHRLVTLTGVGGVGKTRLAIQGGAELISDFPDGVWLVELAPVGEGTAVPDAVAAALGITAQAGLSMSDSIIEALSDRRVLIVLDNCEHVIDAAAELLEVVLARTPRVKVIATSREGLRAGPEHLWAVPSLDLQGGSQSAAVELFIERARSLVAGFELADDAEVAAVIEICERLDGIALAIELAAARMMSMAATEVRDRLSDRFRLLSGARRGLERHQTLHHAVAWSYGLLEDDERDFLDRCSVFADGFDLAAVRNVCGADGPLDEFAALDQLDSLVRKSLVVAARENGRSRYRLLETIRQFAEERLMDKGTIADVRDRHARFFARAAIGHWEAWNGPGFRGAAEWAESEFANLRAGFSWSAFDGGDLETATAIAAHAGPLTLSIQRFEAVGWAEEILDTATAAKVQQLPRLLVAAAFCCWTGRPDEGVTYARAAVSLESDSRYLPFESGWASFIESLGHIYAGQLQSALEISRRLVDLPGAAAVYGPTGLAACLEASGHLSEAMEFAEEGLARARRNGSPFWTAFALWAYGSAFSEADPTRALAAWHEGLTLSRENRMPYWEGFIGRDAAGLNVVDGDPRDALELFDAAIELFHRAGNVAQLTITLASLSRFFERSGRIRQAAALCVDLMLHPGNAALALAPDLPVLQHRLRESLGEAAFDEVSGQATGDLGDTVRATQRQIQLVRIQLGSSA
jgi:predicted ATPase/class 3 adenylate cyclase